MLHGLLSSKPLLMKFSMALSLKLSNTYSMIIDQKAREEGECLLTHESGVLIGNETGPGAFGEPAEDLERAQQAKKEQRGGPVSYIVKAGI